MTSDLITIFLQTVEDAEKDIRVIRIFVHVADLDDRLFGFCPLVKPEPLRCQDTLFCMSVLLSPFVDVVNINAEVFLVKPDLRITEAHSGIDRNVFVLPHPVLVDVPRLVEVKVPVVVPGASELAGIMITDFHDFTFLLLFSFRSEST